MRHPTVGRVLSRNGKVAAAVLAPILALAACGGSNAAVSQSKAPSGTPVLFDVFSPFSGANAFIGTTFNLPPVKMGISIINKAGGILGRPAQVVSTDSGSDPVDAVPALQRMFVQHSNLSGMEGLDSSNATALAPVVNQHQLVTMSLAGPPQLDHSNYKFLYRLSSPDSVQGVAMAQSVLHFGNKKIALMFDSSGTAQSNVPSIVAEVKAHNGDIVLNETLPVDQSSYRTEVERLASSHAQILITETDPQTAATMFSDMKQLGLLGMTVIGGGENDSPQYFSTVAKALGGMAALAKFLYIENIAPASAPGQPYFNKEYSKYYPKAGAPVPPQYSLYDGLNIMALAMDEAHSTSPSRYLKYIKKVTNNPGATVVSTYAQGYALLKQNKKIQYEGASGQLIFNQWNWPPSGFQLLKLQPSGQLKVVFSQPAASINKYFK